MPWLGELVKALSLKTGTKALITSRAMEASVREQTEINYLGEIRRQEERGARAWRRSDHIIPLTGCWALTGGHNHTGKL